MRLFGEVAGMPISEALGWALLHSLWEGILISASLAILLVLTRSPRVRYAAGCVALLATLTAGAVTLVHFLPESHSGAGMPAQAPLPVSKAWTASDGRSGGFSSIAALIPWLGPLWLIGVCLFYVRCAMGWVSIYRLRRRGLCRAPDHWQTRLTRLATELKISRPVALLESLLADTPMVLGHFRPVVLAPLGFLAGGLPADQVEAILLHELAHIGRSDYLVNICQRLAEGLLFYHPAVWWISRLIRVERENCCDDKVVGLRGDAHGYAVALTALEQNRLEQQWSTGASAVAATGGNLMKRVKRLLSLKDHVRSKDAGGFWAPVLAALVLMASTGMAMSAWHVIPDLGSRAKQTSASIENPWQKWLNEDVVYVISEPEREAFERLTTDEERQQFAEQFWGRRDPTPGTPENEFKEEHYRRISFANQHFSLEGAGQQTGKAGWQTARGRIYIQFGPPDEIDSHPNGDAKGPGFEDWLYLHLDNVGTPQQAEPRESVRPETFHFVDRSGNKDYELEER